MDVVPFSDMARFDGVLNLVGHLPHRGPMVDLGGSLVYDFFFGKTITDYCCVGPKLYVAEATVFDDEHSGSTILHMDITDTVNIMMWSAEDDTESSGVAIWHIFPPQSSDRIRQFLWEGDNFSTEQGDPIHLQSLSLTPKLLLRLAVEHRVHPYIIYQKPGEAVFIPAGCAHQVRHYIFVLNYINKACI